MQVNFWSQRGMRKKSRDHAKSDREMHLGVSADALRARPSGDVAKSRINSSRDVAVHHFS